MVEFALVAPIFFLLVFSVIQLGILFGGQNGLVAATRETARYAAPYRVKTATDATNVCADTRLSRQLTAWLSASIPGYVSTNVEERTATYTWLANNNGTYYVQLTVHVSYHFPLYVPLVGGLIDGANDNSLAATASVEFTVEQSDAVPEAIGVGAGTTDGIATSACTR